MAIAVDAAGHAYITGSTNSNRIARAPISGADRRRDDWDVLFAKVDQTGSKLLHVARFGGTAGEAPRRGGFGGEGGTAISVTSDGSIYVAGTTDSPDFPIARGFQTRFGGRIEGFIARLSANGGRILAATFLGGGGTDRINSLALAPAGTLTVAGTTEPIDPPTGAVVERRKTSNDFPVRNALQAEWDRFCEARSSRD